MGSSWFLRILFAPNTSWVPPTWECLLHIKTFVKFWYEVSILRWVVPTRCWEQIKHVKINYCPSLPYITVALYIFYGFRKVKLRQVKPFIKHKAITSSYFNLWSSNMAYQNPWWEAIKVICISLHSEQKKRQEGAFYCQFMHLGTQQYSTKTMFFTTQTCEPTL